MSIYDEIKELSDLQEKISPVPSKDLAVVDYLVDGNLIEFESCESSKYSQRKLLYDFLVNYKAYSRANRTPETSSLYVRAVKLYKKTYKNEVIKMISEDLEELDKCLQAKAYKATLILAGSILEAFLLDWLSEKDGIDYYENDYMVKCVNKKGEEYWKEQDNLCAYIKNIPELQKPKWMADHAHKIRIARNNVHAKLCLSKREGINEKTCKKVIGYLNEVIDARLKSIEKMTQ